VVQWLSYYRQPFDFPFLKTCNIVHKEKYGLSFCLSESIEAMEFELFLTVEKCNHDEKHSVSAFSNLLDDWSFCSENVDMPSEKSALFLWD
jgi:hypothetical protein